MKNEMIITADFVPKLSSKVSFASFDSKSFLICIDNDSETKLNIGLYTKLLLEEIDGNKSIKELTSDFNLKHNTHFTIDEITDIFGNQLIGFGIFEDDKADKIVVKDNYLKLRFIIIHQKHVLGITKLFTFLFHPKVFVVISFLCLLSLPSIFYFSIDLKEFYINITPNFLLYFYCINIFGILLHEFGHAAACKKFGAKCGAIGFGFYLFTPVSYADVTDAWRLRRSKRLIVDTGGIYMQLIFCVILVGVWLLFNEKTYLYVSFAIASTALININPFLRYDGYWALSDLLNIPNLRTKSNEAVFKSIRSIRDKNIDFEATFKNGFLILYGTISIIFMVVFFGYMAIYKNGSIIYFPLNLFNFIKTIIFDFSKLEFSWIRENLTAFILPLMFYFVLIKYLWRRRFKLGKIFKLNF
jgi:putative peptide zinc metalloprotease protein